MHSRRLRSIELAQSPDQQLRHHRHWRSHRSFRLHTIVSSHKNGILGEMHSRVHDYMHRGTVWSWARAFEDHTEWSPHTFYWACTWADKWYIPISSYIHGQLRLRSSILAMSLLVFCVFAAADTLRLSHIMFFLLFHHDIAKNAYKVLSGSIVVPFSNQPHGQKTQGPLALRLPYSPSISHTHQIED